LIYPIVLCVLVVVEGVCFYASLNFVLFYSSNWFFFFFFFKFVTVVVEGGEGAKERKREGFVVVEGL